MECLYSPKPTFHQRTVSVLPNPCTGFMIFRRCGLILQLELSVCHQGYLVYLGIASLDSPLPSGEPRSCLLLFSVANVSSYFLLSRHICCDSQCSSSLTLQIVVSPLLSNSSPSHSQNAECIHSAILCTLLLKFKSMDILSISELWASPRSLENKGE